MSEEILKVFLDDLKTIRVVCQQCGVTIEVDVQSLKKTLGTNKCPACQHDFSRPGGPPGYYPLHELAKIFNYMDAVKGDVTIEFPVKIKEKK